MSKSTAQDPELRGRLVLQIRELFPGALTLKPAEFASLAGKNRIWGYRQIWASKVKALGTSDEEGSPQHYQILIEEAANYFAGNSRYISNFNNERNILPVVGGDATKKVVASSGEADRIYVATLLDFPENRTLIQYVRAKNGQEAGNYALCLDDSDEEREEGYVVVSVFSLEDLNELAQDAASFKGKTVSSLTPDMDRSWAQGGLISD